MPLRRKITDRTIQYAVVVAFVVIGGTIALFMSHAATPSLTLEPEDGTVSAPAMIVDDSSASGGKAITFAAPTGSSGDADVARAGAILLNANRYALTSWYSSRGYGSSAQQTANYLSFGGTAEPNIRPAASEALALAISLKTGLYDPASVSVNTTEAQQKAAKLVRSLAYRHLANQSGGWGNAWQSSVWATYTGMAGWLLWDSPYLSDTDRQNVQNMVSYEANRFIGYQVPYYQNPSGTILAPGDSKAEENAWNSSILSLAVSMLPNSPNYDAWNYKADELMVSAFAMPKDISNPRVINGTSVANWLYGSNANNDGSVINHNRVHPDYMTTISLSNIAGLTSALAGKPAPEATFFNSDVEYAALVDLNFKAGSSYPPGGTIAKPGGTIYIDNSADIYYPQGNDWGTDRRMHFALSDIQAKVFGYDNLASRKGDYWEDYHAGRVLDMQNKNADRRTYTTTAQDTYSGREEWVAVHAAQAYLTYWLQQKNLISKSHDEVPIVIDNLDRSFSVVSGTWNVSTPAGRLGNNNRDARAGNGSSKVRFTPRLTTSGQYKVYAWWTDDANHASNAPYTIKNSAGTTTVSTDQKTNGGKWNLLGTYNFSAGTGGYVELSNNTSGSVTADAVKFERVQ